MRFFIALMSLVSIGFLAGCTQSATPKSLPDTKIDKPVHSFVDMQDLVLAYRRPLDEWPPMELDKGIEVDDLAPITTLAHDRADKAKIELGKQLFLTLVYPLLVKSPVPLAMIRNWVGATAVASPMVIYANKAIAMP